jgi:uncharacterized membrane protein
MGWSEFLIALGVFFASHAIPTRPAVRAPLERALGRRGFTLAYSALSLALLAWLVAAAGRAPVVRLWPWAPWQMWAPNIAMPPACLLAALAIGAPNPLSFGGAHAERFDPARPGAAGLTRHPLLWALALWAIAHLGPNGDLAHVILFGLFAAFALAGMAILDARRRRTLGEGEWRRLSANAPLVPLSRGLPALGPPRPVTLRLAAGLGAWLALLALHPLAIGVSPLPPGLGAP